MQTHSKTRARQPIEPGTAPARNTSSIAGARRASTPLAARPLRAAAALALLITSGCMLEEADATSSAIVGGTIERGYPEVVFIRNEVTGQNCTATIIAPRVVLTAKHCVPTDPATGRPDQPSRFRVQVGTNADEGTYRVSEVRAVPGSWDVFDGADVAVLILATPARERPRALSFDDPSVLLEQSFTAVGYGQRPGGASGVKYSTTNTVESIGETNIRVPPTICTGDSGGPFIGADGRVWGVVSYTFASDLAGLECGRARGAYNTIHQYRAFIERAIADASSGDPSCIPAPETCNGEDDDCDELVDEGCAPDGAACTMDRECNSGTCVTLDGRQQCATSCDPLQPASGCGASGYCAPLGPQRCEGVCRPGRPGARADGDACEADLDCESTRCVNLGAGGRRCAAPCGPGGRCNRGEVCTARAGGCGACVPEDAEPEPEPEPGRAPGASCEADDTCASGVCLDGSCARPCGEEGCGDGFTCDAASDGGTPVCRAVGPSPTRSAGCATSPSSSALGGWLGAALVVSFVRRRRPRARRLPTDPTRRDEA